MPPKKTRKNQFEPKDLVLAKMHGFPSWPSFVMPEDMVPDAILKAKKKTTNYCVIFIPDGDYYWMNDKNLEPLEADKLDKKLDKIPNKNKVKKKTGGRTLQVTDALLASKGLDFDDFMEKLDKGVDGADAVDEEDEDEAGEEFDGADEEQDVNRDNDRLPQEKDEELPTDQSEVEPETNSRSKRRRPDTSTEQHVKSMKRGNGHAKTPSHSYSSEPSDVSNENDKIKSAGSPPKITEEEKQHQLWLCRIKLQRSLIQRNQPLTPANPKQYPPPTANELLVARLILHRLVEFPISLELLKKTKIHKVLKCILRDHDLEYPDSFKLHEKCQELLAKWNPLIDQLKSQKPSKSPQTTATATATHPDSKATDTRPSSLAPDESEISALENVSTDHIKRENGHDSSDYHQNSPSDTRADTKHESNDPDDIADPLANNVSVQS